MTSERYTVDRKVDGVTVRLARCATYDEAMRLIDRDKEWQKPGCVYLVDQESARGEGGYEKLYAELSEMGHQPV